MGFNSTCFLRFFGQSFDPRLVTQARREPIKQNKPRVAVIERRKHDDRADGSDEIRPRPSHITRKEVEARAGRDHLSPRERITYKHGYIEITRFALISSSKLGARFVHLLCLQRIGLARHYISLTASWSVSLHRIFYWGEGVFFFIEIFRF